jgi:hypothetical protein
MPDNNDNQRIIMEQLLRYVAQLEARVKPEHSTKGLTLSNNAFGGPDFKPIRFADLPKFKPFGADQTAKNAAFDCKVRKSYHDPGTL